MEEKNLFLIANTKEREQLVEELKSKFDHKKKHLEDKKLASQINKAELNKNIDQINEQIKQLKQIKSDGEAQEQLKQLENNVTKIYKNDIFPEKSNEMRNMSGIEMLKEIERRLESYLKDLK